MSLIRKKGFYELYVKRILDIICSSLVLIVFSWLYLIIALLVRIKLGSPVIFKQPRPGMIDPETGQERIFCLYKFRTMTDEKDETGKLKPDAERLTPFGKKLRSTSLDELPEVFNILKGDMSIIGPRPQLVRDMVFMTEQQRMRHTAKPGLSGLAQVMGRNSISWEEKLDWDLKYIEKISFWSDVKLILMTAKKVFGREESDESIDLTDDYGDALLKAGKVSKEKYEACQACANSILTKISNCKLGMM